MKEIVRKLLCKLGFHRWNAPLSDYIEQFGCVPIGKIADKAKCEFCGKSYKEAPND